MQWIFEDIVTNTDVFDRYGKKFQFLSGRKKALFFESEPQK